MAFLNEEGLLKFYNLIDGKKANKSDVVNTASGVSVSTISGLSATNVQDALSELKTAIGTGGTSAAVSVTKSTGTDGATNYTFSQGGTDITNGVISVPSMSGYVTQSAFDTLLNTNASSTAIDTFSEIVDFLKGIDNSNSSTTLKSLIDAASAGLTPTSFSQGQLTTQGKLDGNTVYVVNDGSTIQATQNNNTYTLSANIAAMTGATSTTAGAKGTVPAPSAGDQDKVLTGAGTWVALEAIDVDAWATTNGLS